MEPTTTSSSRRRLVPRLPGQAWILIAGACGFYASMGYVSAFLVIYLHEVRGIRLGIAGLALGATALAGVVSSPVVGAVADRVGAKPTLLSLLAIGVVGSISFTFVRSAGFAIVASACYGIGIAGMGSPESTLLATVVPRRQRSAGFAMHYASMSVGLSLGALAGGLFVDINRATTFEMGFFVASVPLIVYAVALTRIVTPANPSTDPDEPVADGGGPSDGYRRVLSDRIFLRVLGFLLCVIVFAGGQFEVAYPAYVVGVAGLGTDVIGYSFAFGSLTVVVGTLFMLRVLDGRRRTRVIYVAVACASSCWLVVLLSGHIASTIGASLGMCVAMVLFAVAETMWSPTYMPLVNELAPDRLRGRYNALSATTEGVGRVVAPVVAGLLLQLGWGDALMVLLAVGTASAALFMAGLERRLPLGANLISASDELAISEGSAVGAAVPPASPPFAP
jgi:MFS family permease